MTVRFFGNVLEYTNGVKGFESENSPSIRALIDELGVRFGEGFKEYLLGDETCFFLVNGKGIMMTGGLNTELQPGDKIEILTVVGGG